MPFVIFFRAIDTISDTVVIYTIDAIVCMLLSRTSLLFAVVIWNILD